jgi:hypothetical protein
MEGGSGGERDTVKIGDAELAFDVVVSGPTLTASVERSCRIRQMYEERWSRRRTF